MSSILHSLRNLFGSPGANNSNNAGHPRRMTRARAQRIARGEEEINDSSDDNNDDDDVFSAFGDDDNDEGSQAVMMMTQEERPAADNNDVFVASSSSPAIESNDKNDGSDNNITQKLSQQDEEDTPSSKDEANNAPLQEFFEHITSSAAGAEETAAIKTISHDEWKKQSRDLLSEYITHRLIGKEEKETSDDCDDSREENGEIMEEESFHSGIMDEAFGKDNDNPDIIDDAAGPVLDEGEEEEEEEDEPLQTQQQLETQEFGFFGGIKRKLGFLSPSQVEGQDDEKPSDNSNSKKKKKRKTILMRRSTPGQMWDGEFSSIPCVSELMTSQGDNTVGGRCYHLNDMDLSSSSVNLGLCRVVKVWNIRLTKRMDRLEKEVVLLDNDGKNEGVFGAWEDDGPLNAIYRKVFSMEVVQFDNDENTHASSSAICNLAAAIPKNAARKRRHTVRRVRIFFYNGYAEAMDALFGQCFDDFVKKRKGQVLLSMVNVPPECIMPTSFYAGSKRPLLQQYVNNPFGDEEFGVSSPYCICIGDDSKMKYHEDAKKIRFDGEGMGTAMEIRLAEHPVDGNPSSGDVASDIGVHDIVVNSTSIHKGDKYLVKNENNLSERYLRMLKGQTVVEEVEFQTSVFDAEEYDKASRSRNDVQNVGIAGLRGTLGNVEDEANEENTDPNATSTSTSGVIARPRFVASLASLPTMLVQGKKDSITVYGVVLGFSPPRITRMNTWMMSIVLIDETMPISREVGTEHEKELHVPSITLNLFAKNKSELPPVRSAGDVICCQKVLLQEYNNEPQLRAKKNSNIIIVRPREARSPEKTLHNSTSSDDWSVSDGRHAIDFGLSNALWRWGQLRLSAHPTMSPNCYLAISQVSNHVDNFEVSVSGDITAVVTSILPTPEHLRRSDTPRGFLRLWDGTGPSHSDPMPNSVVSVNADQSIADPPEQVLIRIEKILKAISSSEAADTTCAGVSAPLALCGRVINAIIWEEDLWNLIQRDSIINIGSFVRLRNINNAMLPSGSRVNCLSVHAKSSMTPLPYDAYEVKMLLKSHDTRLKRGVPTNPASAVLPGKPLPRTQFTAREAAISGFSMLEECLRTPAPASFTVQFEVSHTLPASDLNSIDTLKAFCVKQKDGAVFRFAMHIKDTSAEVDVICHGKVAEDLLGISAQEVSTSVAQCNQALDTLKDYISSGAICEGKIRSVMGKDKRVYFVLCSMFCITS